MFVHLWNRWILYFLIVFWSAIIIFKSVLLYNFPKWYLVGPLSLRKWIWNSWRDFSYSALFTRKQLLDYTTVLFSDFCIHENESLKWDYGIPEFVNYMNHVYMPRRNEQIEMNQTRIVYQKYGTPGIANQMKCACDTLLFALLSNRTFQMITPSILPELFVSPFDQVRFPTNDSVISHSEDGFDLIPHNLNQFDHVYVQGKDSLPTVVSPKNGSMLLLAHRVFSHIMLRKRANRILTPKIGLPHLSPEQWHHLCIPNLFQPSCMLQDLLKPYEQQLKGKFTIGVHVRRAGELAKWKDGISYLSDSNLMKMKRYVEKVARRHKNFAVFIASDSIEAIQLFKSWFGTVITTDDYALEHVGRNPSRSGLIRSSLDLMLLSRCDVLLLTKNSQYSSVSYHLSTHPIIVKYF